MCTNTVHYFFTEIDKLPSAQKASLLERCGKGTVRPESIVDAFSKSGAHRDVSFLSTVLLFASETGHSLLQYRTNDMLRESFVLNPVLLAAQRLDADFKAGVITPSDFYNGLTTMYGGAGKPAVKEIAPAAPAPPPPPPSAVATPPPSTPSAVVAPPEDTEPFSLDAFVDQINGELEFPGPQPTYVFVIFSSIHSFL
jgi:hypothetical protein